MHTTISPLRRATELGPDDTASVCGETTTTYQEMWRRCRRLAGGLHALGLEQGDRVAILAANCHRYLEAYQAVPAAGCVIVPLNTRHSERELRYALEDAGARILITDRDPGSLADTVAKVISLPDEFESLLRASEESDLGVGLSGDDLAGLFYTGGTTGASKGVMLTHGNLTANALHMFTFGSIVADDRWLAAAPMFHAAGTVAVLTLTWVGAAHVILPAFDAAGALDLIENERVTGTLLVPTMLASLAEEQLNRPRNASTLQRIIHGGSPIATETVRQTLKAFPTTELIHVYGATEMGPLATALRHEEALLDDERARSCGQPIVGVDVQVWDDNGQSVDPGTIGEVTVRGPNVMRSYWNKAEATNSVLQDGWYRSGDVGYMDRNSFLYLVDRKKDMVVSGGENVYSTEVEEAIYQHPMVLEAAVFGVPDRVWGEAVYAVVVPRGATSEEELRTHCQSLIASYKVPKTIEIRDEALPKSGAGKILKHELREPHWAGHELGISG